MQVTNFYNVQESQKFFEDIINSKNIFNTFFNYGTKILLALLIIIIGSKSIKFFTKFISKNFIKKKVDISLQSFIISLTKITLYILLALVTAQTVGIQVTSFIAIIASASFAVGLALQGSLSNFAGGIIILLLKPFKVGDYIQALNIAGTLSDVSGTVCEIQIFYTLLNTDDNKKIMIPNSNLSNCSTINFTRNPTRRIEIKTAVNSKENIKETKNKLLKLANENTKILSEPIPTVFLCDYTKKNSIFILRIWCNTEDYWDVYYDLLEQIHSKLNSYLFTTSENNTDEDDDEPDEEEIEEINSEEINTEDNSLNLL
jgi:small conductance mechanosensitive channel